ncbi:hypothetical protein [Mycolicibacterium stellerae]|uniref:hypothetical protein n=1 Tax=Mycolicibacterium stellerae TaxID=2358193 RepID=UPI000F0B9605|nr:hypothetical protein [Mycolicibacterium stellerae]
MTQSRGEAEVGSAGRKVAVDTAVRVYPRTPNETHGVVIEDFGSLSGHAVDIGNHHIADAARRWAVQLADGNLVFVDDADVAPY